MNSARVGRLLRELADELDPDGARLPPGENGLLAVTRGNTEKLLDAIEGLQRERAVEAAAAAIAAGVPNIIDFKNHRRTRG